MFLSRYTPIPYEKIDDILDHVPAGCTFCDLGSGDFRVVNKARERGIDAHGIEINEELAQKTSAIHADFFDVDLSKYDVLFCFAEKHFIPSILEKTKGQKLIALVGDQINVYE